MITLTPTDANHVYVQFKDEKVHGVLYNGSYHAHKYDGKTWEGTRDSNHPDTKAWDYPLNTYQALYASRADGKGSLLTRDISRPARKALAMRCLAAVSEAERTNPQALVQAELESLKNAHRSALDKLKEAEAAVSNARREEQLAWEAFEAHRFQHGFPAFTRPSK